MTSDAIPATIGAPAAPMVWLLGEHPQMRRAMRHWLLMAQSYAVALAMLFVGVQKGLATPMESMLVTGYSAAGLLVFFVWLRAGWSLRARDPLLAFPMALFSVSAIVLSYGLSELSRSAALQILILLVVFEMQRLDRRQIAIVTFGAAAMLLGVLGFLAVRGTPGLDLRQELINIGLAGVMLPLLSTVAVEVRRLRQRQISQRADLEQTLARLHELSARDTLTGLHNRRHMWTLLEQEAGRQARTGHAFAVAILDLDLFKRINDAHGHPAGDEVLRRFSQIGLDVLRTADAIGRWGGEEFVVVLYDVHQTGLLKPLERLREAVAAHPWGEVATGLRVTFSAGVCEHRPGDELKQTLERADRALYEAKEQGRDRALLARVPA